MKEGMYLLDSEIYSVQYSKAYSSHKLALHSVAYHGKFHYANREESYSPSENIGAVLLAGLQNEVPSYVLTLGHILID